jgi:hypothetical protein
MQHASKSAARAINFYQFCSTQKALKLRASAQPPQLSEITVREGVKKCQERKKIRRRRALAQCCGGATLMRLFTSCPQTFFVHILKGHLYAHLLSEASVHNEEGKRREIICWLPHQKGISLPHRLL